MYYLRKQCIEQNKTPHGGLLNPKTMTTPTQTIILTLGCIIIRETVHRTQNTPAIYRNVPIVYRNLFQQRIEYISPVTKKIKTSISLHIISSRSIKNSNETNMSYISAFKD
jgi:hypothetical protein